MQLLAKLQNTKRHKLKPLNTAVFKGFNLSLIFHERFKDPRTIRRVYEHKKISGNEGFTPPFISIHPCCRFGSC